MFSGRWHNIMMSRKRDSTDQFPSLHERCKHFTLKS